MAENGFDIAWLNERFPFDEAARNPEVDQACLIYLSNSETLHLLDVGSGTGANFLHFYDRIASNQIWYFVDHDPRLLKSSVDRIVLYASAQGYSTAETDSRLTLQRANRQIDIHTLTGSFEQIEQLVDLSQLDIAMASAFFDLFQTAQLETFIDKVFASSTALLLTLNYSSMQFLPALPSDKQVIQWYESHMQRPQDQGAAMGAQCSLFIDRFLKNKAAHFVSGESQWQIEGNDRMMLRYLLGFMKTAIGELPLSTVAQAQFDYWWKQRQEHWKQGSLQLRVRHLDFFAGI